MDKLFEAVLKHPWRVSAAVLCITSVAAVYAARVQYDSSLDTWFLEDDRDMVTYRAFLERFGADEITVIGVFAEDIFSPQTLSAIDRLTRAAQAAPHAHRVRSITNVRVARSTEEGLEIAPLLSQLPAPPGEANEARQRALANRWLTGTLVSADARAAAIIVELSQAGADFNGKIAQVSYLRTVLQQERQRSGVRVAMSGSPPLDDALFRYMVRDFSLFAPLTVIAVMVIIFAVFRRLSAVLVPLGVVVVSLIWLFGLMGALNLRINLVSTILPTVVLAVGVADSIHVLAEYYQELARGKSRPAAALASLRALWLPCLVTSLTTAVGMLSLLTSDLQPLRQFGGLAAAAVAFAFVLSIVLGPALLLHTKPADAAFLARQHHGAMGRLLRQLAYPSRRWSAGVLAATAVVLALSGWSVTQLRVGVNSMSYFPSDDPVRIDSQRIDEAMGGSTSLEFYVEAGPDGFTDPDKLHALEQLQEWMESQPAVTRAVSVVDTLKEMHRVLNDGAPEASVVPSNRPLASQLYLLLEGEDDFESQVQDGYSVGRISARAQLTTAHSLAEAVPKVQQRLQRFAADTGMQVTATGFVKLMSKMEQYLLDSQIKSFLAAFIAITLTLLVLLRSLRLALLSMIPNFTPILVGLAVMWVLNIPLDPGTVMIGSLALGLVVDDTVHFLVRLRRFIQRGGSLEEGIAHTMLSAGRPIVVTSVVLAAGFFTLLLASFTPNIHFGGVTAVVILLALAADLVVLPAALIILRPRLGRQASDPRELSDKAA